MDLKQAPAWAANYVSALDRAEKLDDKTVVTEARLPTL